jgi:hypothetical protein
MVRSWNDRLNTPGINGVKPTPRTVGDVVEGQPMLVPTARQVDDFIRTIPNGVEMDVRALRTVAEAANEDLERGMTLNDIAPYWRVLDVNTPTTKKLSFGAEFVAAQRKREGLKP